MRKSSWKARLPGLARSIALIAILLAPSIWMLNVIPPLWRDVDAYVQVLAPPGSATILHYAPLYCFLARVPLYVGQAVNSVRSGVPFPRSDFFLRPVLSDQGIFALLLTQHLALCASAFCLIVGASRLFFIRLVVALVWAANPLFYTFAQCVGSETLTMILLLLIGATGLRIIRDRGTHPARKWIMFGALLWLCILTRHINAVFAALIPLALLFLGTAHLIAIPFARTRLRRQRERLRSRQFLQKAMLGVAIGVCSIVLANISLRILCHGAGIPYHSSIGVTFLWRLKFFASIPAERRERLLDNVAKNRVSPDVENVVSMLREDLARSPEWDVMAFIRRLDSTFNSAPPWRDQKFNLVLNRTAQAFLWPPDPIFLNAVRTDLGRAGHTKIPDVVDHLFRCTTFYFYYPEIMPACAPLSTFRGKNAADLLAVFKKHSYLRHPKRFTYDGLLFFSIVNLLLLPVLAGFRHTEVAVASYATALILVGLLTMTVSCFLCEFLPRFTLPMWELTIIATFILIASTMESLYRSAARRGAKYLVPVAGSTPAVI